MCINSNPALFIPWMAVALNQWAVYVVKNIEFLGMSEQALNNVWKDLMRLGQFVRWNPTMFRQNNIFFSIFGTTCICFPFSVLSITPCLLLCFVSVESVAYVSPLSSVLIMSGFSLNCSWNFNPREIKWVATINQTLYAVYCV